MMSLPKPELQMTLVSIVISEDKIWNVLAYE